MFPHTFIGNEKVALKTRDISMMMPCFLSDLRDGKQHTSFRLMQFEQYCNQVIVNYFYFRSTFKKEMHLR